MPPFLPRTIGAFAPLAIAFPIKRLGSDSGRRTFQYAYQSTLARTGAFVVLLRARKWQASTLQAGRVLDSRNDEKRWRGALEQGSFGVWDLDPELDEVHYSPLWKRRMGFSNEHAADSTSFWRCRVHPDDLTLMLDALRIHIDGSTATYEQKFRLRSSGSGYRTVLSRGRVVERDEQGKPTRMFGTMVDLTARPARPLAGLPSDALGPPRLGRGMPLHHVLGLESRVPAPGRCAAEAALGIAAPACPRARLLELVYDLLDLAGRTSSTER